MKNKYYNLLIGLLIILIMRNLIKLFLILSSLGLTGCDKNDEVFNPQWFNIDVISCAVNITYAMEEGLGTFKLDLKPGEKPVFNLDKMPQTIKVNCSQECSQGCVYVVNGVTYYENKLFVNN